MTLLQQIALYIQENGTCKTKEIAEVFGLEESEVKTILYNIQ